MGACVPARACMLYCVYSSCLFEYWHCFYMTFTAAWFELEEEKNSNVYVSGLPEDVTEDEFKDFMTKVGVLAFDPVSRKPKIKLYTNADGTYKGDGRCCYIKVRIIYNHSRHFGLLEQVICC